MGSSTPKVGGMLYVVSSPGPKVPLDEFNKWYDEDHIPLRRSVTGVLNAARYVAVDNKEPEWIATYELEDVAVLESPAYLDQWKTQTDYDKDILGRCAIIDRRVYKCTFDKRSPDYDQHDQKLYQPVALAPGPKLEESDFHGWYLDEHIPMLSAVPGWLRSSRWELCSDSVRPNGVRNADGSPVSPYLAIHEWVGPQVYETPEFKAATNTPWRTRVMDGIDKSLEDRRLFKAYRLWK